MSLKLIKETSYDEVEPLYEGNYDDKKLYISGPFLQQEVRNRNNRIYRAHIMEREANRYINEHVNNKTAWGELQHPERPNIDFNNVSHRITSLVQEGNNWMGKALILNNPKGDIVRSLIDSGGKVGVSSRGLGSLRENNGINEVQADFRLMTAADIVADPSAPDAFVNGIMEGKEWIWENGIIKEAQIDQYKKVINTVSKSEMESRLVEAFTDFLSKLKLI